MEIGEPLYPVRFPGWYGKIASLGDFASRRLPPEFVAPWDRWQQEVISGSQAQLGEAWLDAYLTCPVWRFLLQPGACGEASWAGVLMPSVDRVGRYFPLTIACRLPRLPGGEEDFQNLAAWLDRLETLALSTLDTGCDAQRFDETVLAAPCPLEARPVTDSQAARYLLATLLGQGQAQPAVALVGSDALAATLADLERLLAADAARGTSLWWTSDADGSRISLFPCPGLPDASRFAAMLRESPGPERASTPPGA